MTARRIFLALAALLALSAAGCDLPRGVTVSVTDRSSSYVSPDDLNQKSSPVTNQNNYKPSSEPRRSHIPPSTPEGRNQSDYISGRVATTFSYNVDGMDYTGEVFSDAEMLSAYARLVDFAKSGHSVSIGANGATQGREVCDTLVSASEDEVVAWVSKMVRKGCSVTVEWDADARLYRCTAYRKTK